MTKTNFINSRVKFQHSFLILILILLSLTIFTNIGHAQDKYQDEGTAGSVYIWNSGIYSDVGYIGYLFTIDVKYLITTNINDITGLVIQTNYGDIKFDDEYHATENTLIMNGTLDASRAIEGELQIIKALGVVNGKILDITDLFDPFEFTPVKIVTPSRQQGQQGQQGQTEQEQIDQEVQAVLAACPYKTINTGTETGTFLGLECGDYCFIKIKRDADGKETDFLAGGDSDLFDAKPGTKVTYNYENIQTYIFYSDFNSSPEGYCFKGARIDTIKETK
jgi:hypothetical protein